jgi:hypothetical protein
METKEQRERRLEKAYLSFFWDEIAKAHKRKTRIYTVSDKISRLPSR